MSPPQGVKKPLKKFLNVSCSSLNVLFLQVEILSCFRPGDVVRAEVLSVGDHRSFFLTTARNDLGVVFAKSIAGGHLCPFCAAEDMIAAVAVLLSIRAEMINQGK